eukprot:757768-Hanusia_phi.AAC.3
MGGCRNAQYLKAAHFQEDRSCIYLARELLRGPSTLLARLQEPPVARVMRHLSGGDTQANLASSEKRLCIFSNVSKSLHENVISFTETFTVCDSTSLRNLPSLDRFHSHVSHTIFNRMHLQTAAQSNP